MFDLHYLTYDPDAMWEEMMKVHIENGGDVLYGGDEKELLLRSVQAIAVQIFAGVDNALRMATLRYAQGDYLKLLGEERGCPYNDAEAAVGTAEITLNANGKSGIIAAGTVLTADGERFFRTLEDVEHTGQARIVRTQIECTEAGVGGNGALTGTDMRLVVSNPAVSKIMLVSDTTGGSAAEDLELYRERIRQSGMASVTTGPKDQYEAKAKAASTRVMDAKATMQVPGVVDVVLLLDSGANGAEIIRLVNEALSAQSVRPLTDRVNVLLATSKAYAINVGYTVDARTEGVVMIALQQAVDEYREWQENAIGRAFDPYRLMAMLYQSGATRVVFQAGSHFDGGALVYAPVDDYTRVSGVITLEAMP